MKIEMERRWSLRCGKVRGGHVESRQNKRVLGEVTTGFERAESIN